MTPSTDTKIDKMILKLVKPLAFLGNTNGENHNMGYFDE
jgi:hypothetical protein